MYTLRCYADLLCRLAIGGAATWYGPGFYDQPTCCGPLMQDYPVAYAAVDPIMFEYGWRCGDDLLVTYVDGTQEVVKLYDTGYLNSHYIEDYGPDYRIVLDIAEFDWPFDLSVRSSLARVENLSLRARLLHRKRVR